MREVKDLKAQDLNRLWNIFVGIRKEIPYNSDLEKAYFKYYMPLNAFRIWKILKKVNFFKKELRVLDLGTGSLSAILGIYLSNGWIKEIHAVDKGNYGKIGRKYIQKLLGKEIPITFFFSGIEEYLLIEKNKFKPNLVVLSYVLNEINMSDFNLLKVTLQLIELLTRDGLLIIVEPAMQEASSRVQKIKTWLNMYSNNLLNIDMKKRSVVTLGKSWYYWEVNYKRSRNIKIIDKNLDIKRNILRFSLLCVEKEENISRRQTSVLSGLMYSDGVFRKYLSTKFGKISISQDESSFISNFVDTYRGDYLF
ncbi:MAG: hypothetical protein HYS16_00445 [Deltaproteobacteria bacterium]|nr:MAG: hypothetical protein HYS16_00445 [Deltaproteobacteria bacterium]